MAFWGVEVKPGKPVTHLFDRTRGRLRISQATLNIGSSTEKSLVQCNVGNKSPVLLCALMPGKTESCHLDLEFEETDEVVFSVLGPRSVYLTGYYLNNTHRSNLDNESESYGEDIANTETEESNPCSQEDEYEDSFIDDDDLEVLEPSPISSNKGNKKPKGTKGTIRRLRKKYQSIDSDDDTSSRKQNLINGSGVHAESEDNTLLSEFRIKRTTKNDIVEAGEEHEELTVQPGHKKVENGGIEIISKGQGELLVANQETEGELDPKNCIKSTRKRKKGSEVRAPDATSGNKVLKESKVQLSEEKIDTIDQALLVREKDDMKPTPDIVSFENSPKPKKRKKEKVANGRTFKGISESFSNSIERDQSGQDVEKIENKSKVLALTIQQDQEPTNKEALPDGYKSEEKKTRKKKKKKSKHLDDE